MFKDTRSVGQRIPEIKIEIEGPWDRRVAVGDFRKKVLNWSPLIDRIVFGTRVEDRFRIRRKNGCRKLRLKIIKAPRADEYSEIDRADAGVLPLPVQILQIVEKSAPVTHSEASGIAGVDLRTTVRSPRH